MRLLAGAFALALVIAAGLWRLAEPVTLDPGIARAMAAPGDAAAGEIVFWTGGCAACHAARDTPTRLAGGAALKTPFGEITPPNISPDPKDGIGAWTAQDFAHALFDGVDARGEHLYPAFPYPSYRHMSVADARDLWAFLKTMPPVKGESPAPALRFPYDIRRAVGLWKWLYLSRAPPPEAAPASRDAAFGRYLAEGAGHCGECHTPRDFLGGPIAAKALAGAPMPDGKSKSGNLTAKGLGQWTQDDVETALTTGITPDGDSLGDGMADVVRDLAHLPKSHVTAIARYLKGG